MTLLAPIASLHHNKHVQSKQERQNWIPEHLLFVLCCLWIFHWSWLPS